MLVLRRNIGETIKIGDDVDVIVWGTRNGQVRIGVKAPKSVEVHRKEVYERIQKEKLANKPAQKLD